MAEQRGSIIVLEAMERRFAFLASEPLSARNAPSWYSSSYGVRLPCIAIDLERTVTLDGEYTVDFAVMPYHGQPDPDLHAVHDSLRDGVAPRAVAH